MNHTHKLITSKTLRSAYANELWQARVYRSLGKDEFWAMRLGIESGIWAVQKILLLDVLK